MDLSQMAHHIEVLNREMSSVKTSIDWIKLILGGQLTLLLATLGFSWRAKVWSKINGLNKNRK